MKEKELLKNEAKEKLFQAQKELQEVKRKYNHVVRIYYKVIDKINSEYPDKNNEYEIIIKMLLKANNISDFEIKNYNNPKVFKYIDSNINNLISAKIKIKNALTLINPDNIYKLSVILAALDNNYLLEKIIKNVNKSEYIDKIIDPIIKNTYGVIVFKEQVTKIIDLIFNANEYEIDMFFETLSRFRKLKYKYITDIDSSIPIIDFIKQYYCETYIEQYKVPYYGFISSATEKGIKEDKAHELFNLLLAYFSGISEQYEKEKELHAKQLYKIGYISLNYPNKPSGVKNEN